VVNDRESPTTFESHRSSIAVRWAVAATAAAYVGYLALLVTCDLFRVAPPFVPLFHPGDVVLARVVPGSDAARGGLQSGDRIRRVSGQVLRRPADWHRVRAHLDPSKPLDVEIERAGQTFVVRLTLPSGLHEWRSGPARPGLIAFRSAQIVTLAFALLVAYKRHFQRPALLGALLLASIATLSLALPMRMAVFWQAMPPVLSQLIWLPFATSAAVGPLLFAFFAVFPRPAWPARWLGVALLPAALIVVWHLAAWYQIAGELGSPTWIPDSNMPVIVMNALYAVVAVMLLMTHRRAAKTLTEQRRFRVLVMGAIVGAAAGLAVAVGYLRNPGTDIFATRAMTLLALVFLAMPASFTYAILRHRLFDISLIVRLGIRYALARRFVTALIPALGAVLLIDVLAHRGQPLVAMLQSRWWWFTLIGAALLLVRSRRERWLKGVDRRFFRERYDAQRLLRSVAQQISRASSFEAVAPALTQQVAEALHPEFVSVLRQAPGNPVFTALQTGAGAEDGAARLPASLAVIGVLSVLRKPLALSLGDTAWVRHQLSIEERDLLIAHRIELLVPISSETAAGPPLALLVLGPRRSEEPYNQEDLDLLETIAQALGLLLERSSGDRRGSAECERCGRCYDPWTTVCADDNELLTITSGARLLNERYRLERRLGRGGMGAVYGAVDEVLERTVAVKLIREDTMAPLDLAARFRLEARMAAGFAHPHVVRVYDFGVDRYRRPFLVMELLEGETLRQRLASGAPLGVPEALHVLRGVCSALGAAHAQGLVHRDLKPENIFLQRHGSGVVPKVLDFGLARALVAGSSRETGTATGSSAGLLIGTLEYMSPEQVAGDEVSPGWDIWALGVIAYEMLIGGHPFRRTVAFSSGLTAAALTLPRYPEGPRLSEGSLAFFQTALSTESARRPADAMTFLAACEQVLA
jgi:hypothetical protein